MKYLSLEKKMIDIIEEKDKSKAYTLLSGTFHEIKDRITVILTTDIEEFYKTKVNEARLRERLKL